MLQSDIAAALTLASFREKLTTLTGVQGMRRAFGFGFGLASIFLLMVSPVSAAEWLYNVDKDPFSDEQVAAIMGGGAGGVTLGAKCWAGKPEETVIILGLPVPFDRAADYKPIVTLKMRIDDGVIHELLAAPTDFGGNLGFVTGAAVHAEVVDYIREWRGAKKRIAMGAEDRSHIISPRGTSRAVEKFLATCGLASGGD